MKDLAITISLYNRWLELGGLLELLRLNWKGGRDLHIIVISTASEDEFPNWIDRKMIDHIEFGSRFPMPNFKNDPFFREHFIGRNLSKIPYLGDYLLARQRKKLKKITRSRTVDSFIRGGIRGIESGRAYTLHLHAATWPFREDKVYEITDMMKNNNYIFACRGFGKKLVSEKLPSGDIDDNFFIIDNNFASKTNFWNFDPGLDAETISNEGRLARRVYEKCPEDKIYFFDNFSNPNDYIFPEGTTPRRVQPFNYFKPMGLLRSHDLRKQAELCQRFKLKGPIIENIIEDNI